jgi:hypothetical protein
MSSGWPSLVIQTVVLVTMVLAAPSALAEEAKEEAEKSAETAKPKEAARPSSWTLTGFVDTYFAYNPNRPFDGANFLRGTGTTAKRANEFSINQAVIGLSREPAPVGINLVFGFGTGFDVLHAAETPGPGIGPQVWRHLLTATVSYRAPVGRGLVLEAGVFSSHIGLETFYSKDNWTYTRGWMGEFSPYYQTGIVAKYSFSDTFAAQLHLLNGWEIIGDNNEGKAVGAQAAWTFKRLTFTLNGFAGPEAPNSGDSWRLFLDTIAILKVSERLSLAATADFGRQGRPGESAALWYAAGVDGRYALTKKLAAVLRVEGYRDETGIITGTAQTLTNVTAALELRPTAQLILKLEGRVDHSTAAVFSARRTDGRSDIKFVPNQALAVLGAVATF